MSGFIRRFSRVLPVILFLMVGCRTNPFRLDPELEEALEALEQTMEHEPFITAAKEARIDSIRSQIPSAGSAAVLYGLYDVLFEEYLKWECDSALSYAHRKERLARELDDPVLENDAAEDVARRYIISGMYHDALQVMDRAIPDSVGDRLSSRSYLIYDIYHGMVLSTSDEQIRSEYRPLETEYLLLASRCIPESNIDYYNIQGKILIPEGRPLELINRLQGKLSDEQCTFSETAVLQYWIAKAYETIGDRRNAFLYYLRSARADLESPTREYRSLICVSQFCYEYGMTAFAYKYIVRSYGDALLSQAHIRLNQIGDTMAKIVTTYDHQLQRRHRMNSVMLVMLSLSILLLVLAIIYLIASRSQLRRANGEVLGNLRALKESNRIKDTYLGQFLSMFTSHIDALERYRSQLRIIAKRRDLDALVQELHADDFIDEEWAFLYGKFDTIFLGLFPDFVEQLNTLLKPDQQLSIPSNGKLTNEIRAFALIRLGITDSARIAKYLRKSVTTIYNYRVKMRNAALGKRETFEERVMQIGT